MTELNQQEKELLEAHSLPLRNYLMKYVMPSLTKALLDCSRIKPEDPVDFVVPTHWTPLLWASCASGERKWTDTVFVFFTQAEHLLRNHQQE